MVGSDESHIDATAAISALSSAIDAAFRAIQSTPDNVDAFHASTRLWFLLRNATDANGRVRALLAALIADEHPELDTTQLAQMLSTDGHPMKRARASDLAQMGRRLRQGDTE